MPENETIADRVKKIRKILDLTNETLSSRLGIGKATLSNIETGVSKPCHDFFYAIVQVFNVNPYYLLFGQGDMFSDHVDTFVNQEKGQPYFEEKIKKFLEDFKRSNIIREQSIALHKGLLNTGLGPLIKKEIDDHRKKEQED